MNQDCKQKDNLIMEISILDFAVTDLREYLDTHPYDSEYIDCLYRYAHMRNQAIMEYEENFGPINYSYTDGVPSEWTPALCAMPWQGGR